MEQNKLNELEQAIRAVCKETIKSVSLPEIDKEGKHIQSFSCEPLHLEHILRTMNKKTVNLQIDIQWAEGVLAMVCDGKNETWWNLTKPLALQSPETIDFLHSIICGKE